MSDEKQGSSQRPDAEPSDPLSQRRPLKQDDHYYDRPLCPCEETEPENQSEYDVAGEWVTYDGPINEDIFDGASNNAAMDLEAQMRAYYQEPVAPPPPSAVAPVPNDDAPKAPEDTEDTEDPEDPEDPEAPKADGGNHEWTAVVAEIYAVESSTEAELVDKEASKAAEKVDALLDPQAAEREKQEPRHFASIGDYPVKNLVYNLEELPEVGQAIFVKRNFQYRGTCYSSSQSSRDAVAIAESADAQAPQANDGGVAQVEIIFAESQAVYEASCTAEVVNE